MAVGCGTHTSRIVDRGGSVVSTLDVMTKVVWGRILNDVSTATVTVQPDGDCCESVGNIRAWRQNLQVFRQGKSVWEGPILNAQWTVNGLEINAIDIVGWLDMRVPHQSISFTSDELTEIAEWLIEDAFAPDDPGHSVQVVGKSKIRGDRSYTVDVGQSGDHLRDLAATGIDFTAVGSRIVILPDDHTARIGSLTDEDFPDGLIVAEDGGALGTRWIVHGKDDIKGVAGGIDSYYGLLERVVEETSILDDVSAGRAAASRLRSTTPVPVFIDSSQVTLAPDAAVDVPTLVPGWCVDVTSRATCRPISQLLKIYSLKVTEDGDGESVVVQLVPTGS